MPVERYLNGIGGTVVVQVSGYSPLECHVKQWKATRTTGKSDRTNAASKGFRVRIPGVSGLEGTMTGFIPKDKHPDLLNGGPLAPERHLNPVSGESDPDKYYVAMTLNIGNSKKYYSLPEALIENFEITSDTEEGVEFTCAFESVGPYTGPNG